MKGIGLAELDELAGQAVRAALTSSTSVCDISQCAFLRDMRCGLQLLLVSLRTPYGGHWVG